tara:strand:+ start:197 stop:541 length:345 start_codon:yes stop_codon:yes gene_type:complete
MTEIPQYMFLITWIVLALIALSLIGHGLLVVAESHGYRKNPKVKSHPEMEEVQGTGVLLGVTFTGPKPELPELEDEDPYKLLHERIREKRESLWDEPSPYEDEDDDDNGMAGIR